MNRAVYEGFNAFCDLYLVILQTVLFLVIWDIFYGAEKGKKEALFASAFAAVNVVLRLCPSVPGWGRYVVSAAMALAYCHIRYRGCLQRAVFTLLLFYNFHGMSFLISSSIYQFMTDEMLGRLDVQDASYMHHMYKGLAFGQACNLFFYTLTFILMTWILKRIVKRPLSMSWLDTVFLSALNVVGSMLAWMVVDLLMVPVNKEVFCLFTQKREMVWRIPMIAVLLYTGEISAVYIFRKYKELQSEREKHFVEEQHMKAMKRRLEEAEHFYGGIRRVRHEMKNHMANLKGLVAGEKYGEVEKYIEKLDQTIQELDYKFSTGNAVTDVIINDKYRRAANAGIAFRVKFEYRETDTVSAFDMGIVLNNLLDNAIEACEKLEREKRYISLTLKRKNHFLLIEVKNSFDGKMEWREGEAIPATTKQEGLSNILPEHGIGLENVRDVAERYLGYMNVRAEENVFRVTVMLQQGEDAEGGKG
ncbi:MAG: GHKL domain-containing protein [Lachnospiraceae bacterium]|nr:GHKL domain-containing protein [Lachnospiraceae bacterium]